MSLGLRYGCLREEANMQENENMPASSKRVCDVRPNMADTVPCCYESVHLHSSDRILGGKPFWRTLAYKYLYANSSGQWSGTYFLKAEKFAESAFQWQKICGKSA